VNAASFQPPDPPAWLSGLSEEQVASARAVPHLAGGYYAGIDPRHALDYFLRRHVRPFADVTALTASDTVADIGAGYGWLAMALAWETPARVIAVEPEAERLEAAREIARRLGVPDGRIDWRVGSLAGPLPMLDREATAVFCIEVIEHVQGNAATVRDLARVSDQWLIVTTPNQWFPVIAHDTRLPFCHWLPMPLRRVYAAVAGRGDSEHNRFWSPRSLSHVLNEFERVSPVLNAMSMERLLASFPAVLPYGPGGRLYQRRLHPAKVMLHRVGHMLGARHSHWIAPNLAGVWRRH